jgi:hypothetical protein
LGDAAGDALTAGLQVVIHVPTSQYTQLHACAPGQVTWGIATEHMCATKACNDMQAGYCTWCTCHPATTLDAARSCWRLPGHRYQPFPIPRSMADSRHGVRESKIRGLDQETQTQMRNLSGIVGAGEHRQPSSDNITRSITDHNISKCCNSRTAAVRPHSHKQVISTDKTLEKKNVISTNREL